MKGCQKSYGKAIYTKSLGFVQSELKRKAEKAGGSFNKFSTQKTHCLSIHSTPEPASDRAAAARAVACLEFVKDSE